MTNNDWGENGVAEKRADGMVGVAVFGVRGEGGWLRRRSGQKFFAPERKFCLQFKNYEDISVLVPCVTGL